MRKSLLPVRKFAKRLSRPGTSIVKRLLQPFGIFAGKKGLGLAGRTLAQTAGFEALFGGIGYRVTNPIARRFINKGLVGFFSGPLGRFFDRRSLAKTLKELRKGLDPGDLRKLRGVGLAKFLQDKAANILSMNQMGLRPGVKKITKKLATNTAKRAGVIGARKAPKKLVSSMTEGVLARAFKSKAVQRLLLQKIGPEAMERIGVKAAAGGVKGGFPIVGTGYAVIEGLVRLIMGDPKGMMLSFGSGIPTAGWAFAIIDILRDIDRRAYDRHIEPNLPFPNDTAIAGFFQDAIGLSPDQYERGNVNLSMSGISSNVNTISDILGVTKAFGEATGFSPAVQSLITSDGLAKYPVNKPNYSFDVGKGFGGRAIQKQQQEEDKKELKKTEREKKLEKNLEEEEKKEGVDVDIEIHSNPFMDNIRDFTGGEVGDGVFTLPFGIEIPNIFHGGGGIGGNDTIQATTPIMGGDGATIQFWGEQGRDLSGEPGVDFSYKDYKSNYSLFPGYILETGLLYGSRYGNVVVVRSVDPSNGLEFDSLYAHFPNGGIAVKPGQVVSAGEYLGAVGFIGKRGPNGEARMQGNGAGNMSGYHTSVDFYEPGSYDKYRNLSVIQSLVTGAEGQTPVGLLEKLKPPTNSDDTSTLNNIEANSNLASTMTNMVENGSNERLMTQRQASSRLPIVIINNQTVNTSQNLISFGGTQKEGNFFEAYNLARHTV